MPSNLEQDRLLGIFEYARLKIYIDEILDGVGDVVNRRTLKPLLRDSILRDAALATLSTTILISWLSA